MKNIVGVLFLLLLLWECKPKEAPPAKGAIYVVVKDQYGKTINDAIITAEPAIPESKTDNFGSVLIKNLTIGTYELIASKAQYGSGKTAVLVKSDDITNVTIILEYGKFASFAPGVKIEFPVRPANFSVNENILFKGYVTDNDTPVETLDIRWESSADGLLDTGKPDKDGIVSFSTSKLTRKTHIIWLIAKDKSGNIGRDSMIVSTLAPKQITLAIPEKMNGEIKLAWSKSDDIDFKEYRLYRANQDCDENSKVLLGTFQDINITTYTDARPPFTTKVCYFIEVITNTLMSRRSNRQQVDFPSGYFLDFIPNDVVVHPTKPWVFLCRKEKNQVVVYDYEASKIVTEISTPQPSGFLLIGENGYGINLYVPCNDNAVYIFNADDFNLKKTLITGAPATDVAISGNGVVFVTVNNQWTNPISSYDEKAGLVLGTLNSLCIYGGSRIRKIPKQNTLMVISTSISPTDMDLIFYDSKGNFLKCKDDSQHGSYPLDATVFRISPNGNYVLTANSGAAYSCEESMKYFGQISRGELTFSDFAFNSDGSVFYGATSNRQSIQIGKFPELTRHDEILMKGFPLKIFVKENKIVSLSRVGLSSNNTAVEIVKIP